MMARKWRPNLRTRITITLMAVAVGVAATTAGALVWNARSIILESRQAAVYDVLRVEAKMATAGLPERPTAGDMLAASEEFSVLSVLINLRTGESGGTLGVDEIPDYLLETLVDNQGLSAYERVTRYGQLSFIAGVAAPAGSTGDPIAVFGMFDMQTQQEEIDRLVSLGVAIGLVFVVTAAGVGLIVGRQLGRPLRRLVEAADGLGSRDPAAVVDTGYPDVNVVLDAMRHSEARLDTTIGKLEESEATARQLVADVAHELRTPLATLVAVSEILADTESATAQNRQEAGAIAARSATHLTALTNDILEMSRFDSGQSEVTRQRFDITELWGELSELRQWEGVSWELYGRAQVTTDKVRFRLILSNLVTNAVKHGSAPVAVRVWVLGGKLTLTVADSGTGIPPEHVDRVFNRFYKANAARSNSESSGLGLAIVRENARVLGGEAWLMQDVGTVFAVWFPVER